MGSGASAISDSVDRKHKRVRALGSGGFGVVSAVKSVVTGQVLARKDVYFGKWAGLWYDKNLLQAVFSEIGLMASLRHPNIVRIYNYEAFVDQRTISVYMECCDGSVLKLVNDHVAKGKKLPGPILIHIAKNVLKALEYLHHRNIVHRDLKPENILYKREGNSLLIKLSDFGVSIIHQNVNDYVFASGTLPYMAPEVLKAARDRAPSRVTVSSDLWSFAVTIEQIASCTESGHHKQAALAVAKKCKLERLADRPTARAALRMLNKSTGGAASMVRSLVFKLVHVLLLYRCYQLYTACGSIGGAIFTMLSWELLIMVSAYGVVSKGWYSAFSESLEEGGGLGFIIWLGFAYYDWTSLLNPRKCAMRF